MNSSANADGQAAPGLPRGGTPADDPGVLHRAKPASEPVGIKDTRWAPIVPYAARGLPIAAILMNSCVDTLPYELIESARIEGASDLRTYRSLILSIISQARVAVAIFSAPSAWNEFLLALHYVPNESLKTIPAGSVKG